MGWDPTGIEGVSLLSTVMVVAALATVAALVALVCAGHRWRRGGAVRAVVVAAVGAGVVGELAARWLALPSTPVLMVEGVLVAASLGVALLRRAWNPLGVWFLANLVVAETAYLAYGAWVTMAGGMRPGAAVLSGLLWGLEAAALLLAATFAFETCDVVCRIRWDRPIRYPAHDWWPFVSVHVAACNEPPDMLIETIRSLEALDYPAFEIVVIDNNTEDPDVWKPVEEYCAGRPLVRFVHVAPWPGFKSGALNLVLDEYTDPRAEVIGVVDADYLVDPDWLAELAGWFADPAIGFVQTPQDYREWEGDAYLTACHDAYAYFFAASMRARDERNSAIFGGTMGLIRRSALEQIGGWDEWCITEDAEASLRIYAAGYEGVYVHESYGKGIMPLTFDALKRQRFRWCFGGIQILRKHHRRLVPWQRRPADRLSTAQRLDFLVGGAQWGTDLVALGFAFVIVASAAALLAGHPLGIRPFVGPAIVLPLTLTLSGGLRALWTLRILNGLSPRRAALAFANWLALSLTVAYATALGIVRRDGVFLRTPKWRHDGGLPDALRAARTETALATGLVAAAVLATARGVPGLGAFALWQAGVYASAPTMAWLNLHTELSARLQRRQRSEDRRERLAAYEHHAAGAAVVLAVAGCLALVGLAVTAPGAPPAFELPQRSEDDAGPFGNLGVLPSHDPDPDATGTSSTTATTADRTPAPPTTPTDPSGTARAAIPATTTSIPGAAQTGPTTSLPPQAAAPTSTPTSAAPTPASTTPSVPADGGPPTSRPGPP